MCDPTNVLALDDLEALAGLPIKPVVAAESELRHVQDRVFGIREEVHEFFKGSNGRPSKIEEGDTLSVGRGTGPRRWCGSSTWLFAGLWGKGRRTSTSSRGRRNSWCATVWTAFYER